MQKIESLFKYQSHLYNFQSNNYVKHRFITLRWNKKLFPSLNVINSKSAPYISKGVLRHYHYRSYPKLGTGIVAIVIIPFINRACKTILSLPWNYIIKEACNHPRFGRVYNFK